MIGSLVRRKSTYLAKEEWCTVPWRERTKRFDEKLFDKGLYLAGLLDSFDRFSRMINLGADVTVYNTCLLGLEDLGAQLDRWYVDLQEEYRSPLYWFDDQMYADDQWSNGSPLSRYAAVQFPNMRVANAILVYWALRIIVGHTISSIHQSLSQAKQPVKAASSPKENIPDSNVVDQVNQRGVLQRAELCANIFQSIRYFMRPDFGVNGTLRSLFPLGAAMDEMARQADNKIMWGSSIYAQIMSQKGINWPMGMLNRNGQKEVINQYDSHFTDFCFFFFPSRNYELKAPPPLTLLTFS